MDRLTLKRLKTPFVGWSLGLSRSPHVLELINGIGEAKSTNKWSCLAKLGKFTSCNIGGMSFTFCVGDSVATAESAECVDWTTAVDCE